eukprot:TRINITY_DN2268_c0_g1_i4.p2 TRINITY_DN2268_c0_g1~~TRINITY_DN2268_c0_g1_i4.p2  ORF type:complete len:163 (+),score=29.25 TRINITY_DN2268_c0_g1_i4:13-501(+)
MQVGSSGINAEYGEGLKFPFQTQQTMVLSFLLMGMISTVLSQCSFSGSYFDSVKNISLTFGYAVDSWIPTFVQVKTPNSKTNYFFSVQDGGNYYIIQVENKAKKTLSTQFQNQMVQTTLICFFVSLPLPSLTSIVRSFPGLVLQYSHVHRRWWNLRDHVQGL